MFSVIYSVVIDPLLRGIRVYLPEFAGVKAGNRVLDVCCGTGDQVFHYARRGIMATGIDLGADMIKLAERSKRKQGLGGASFQRADALNLPFEDNSFDYASISFALHEVERTARDGIISEMKRVVREAGALIFADFQTPLPSNRYARLIKAIEFIAGGNHFRYFNDYIEQGGLDEILRKNHLSEEKRGYLVNGLVVVIKARNG